MRNARVDNNQKEIVAALRQAGATVQHLHMVGRGCPDLVVGFRGVNYMLEIKQHGKRLTPDEAEWHETWNGNVAIVHSVDDALEVIGAVR